MEECGPIQRGRGENGCRQYLITLAEITNPVKQAGLGRGVEYIGPSDMAQKAEHVPPKPDGSKVTGRDIAIMFVLMAYNIVGTAKIVFYSVFEEFHASSPFECARRRHYHIAIKADKPHRWLPVVKALRTFGVFANFSSRGDEYAYAFRYCFVPSARKNLRELDKDPLLSPGIPPHTSCPATHKLTVGPPPAPAACDACSSVFGSRHLPYPAGTRMAFCPEEGCRYAVCLRCHSGAPEHKPDREAATVSMQSTRRGQSPRKPETRSKRQRTNSQPSVQESDSSQLSPQNAEPSPAPLRALKSPRQSRETALRDLCYREGFRRKWEVLDYCYRTNDQKILDMHQVKNIQPQIDACWEAAASRDYLRKSLQSVCERMEEMAGSACRCVTPGRWKQLIADLLATQDMTITRLQTKENSRGELLPLCESVEPLTAQGFVQVIRNALDFGAGGVGKQSCVGIIGNSSTAKSFPLNPLIAAFAEECVISPANTTSYPFERLKYAKIIVLDDYTQGIEWSDLKRASMGGRVSCRQAHTSSGVLDDIVHWRGPTFMTGQQKITHPKNDPMEQRHMDNRWLYVTFHRTLRPIQERFVECPVCCSQWLGYGAKPAVSLLVPTSALPSPASLQSPVSVASDHDDHSDLEQALFSSQRPHSSASPPSLSVAPSIDPFSVAATSSSAFVDSLSAASASSSTVSEFGESSLRRSITDFLILAGEFELLGKIQHVSEFKFAPFPRIPNDPGKLSFLQGLLS